MAERQDAPLTRQQHAEQRGISRGTFFMTLAIATVVAFALGTRSDQLFATIAPVFGFKVSNDKLDTQILQQTYQNLKANYDGTLDPAKLADGAARGMTAAAGDKYTVFMDKSEASEFNKALDGQVSGIGAEIGVRNGQPTVIRVLADSPAEKAGLKANDLFVSVNGESVEGKDASAVAEKVRGEAGTSVKLTMKRGDMAQDYTITRAQVNDPSVRWSVDGTIGTMTITRFDEQTGALATQAANEFKQKGVKSIIVDLRDNGGGYLNAAQKVASLWLDHKTVVTEKTNGKVTDTVTSDMNANPPLTGLKTIVLVNGQTASASEIVAGALQDYGVAQLVGEKTFGKGSVQKVIDLPDGRILKVTVAKWYTPKDKNINAQGIAPDKTVELKSEDADAGRDPQLEAAKQLAE